MTNEWTFIKIPECSEEEWRQNKLRTDFEWKRVLLPIPWSEIKISSDSPVYGARLAVCGKRNVIFSAARHDGTWWLHVSISHPEKIPSYTDLAEVKQLFIGPGRQAIQVFPAEAEHINIAPHVLHLWTSLEPGGDGLPHFGRFGTI